MPQYLIVANSRCRTHPPGYNMIYTGPRSGVSPGWTVIHRYHDYHDGSGLR